MEDELQEQARLLGASGSREAALIARLDEADKLLSEWQDFAKDVMASDACGYDWLNGIRSRTQNWKVYQKGRRYE
jgi:hypothetical protein